MSLFLQGVQKELGRGVFVGVFTGLGTMWLTPATLERSVGIAIGSAIGTWLYHGVRAVITKGKSLKEAYQ